MVWPENNWVRKIQQPFVETNLKIRRRRSILSSWSRSSSPATGQGRALSSPPTLSPPRTSLVSTTFRSPLTSQKTRRYGLYIVKKYFVRNERRLTKWLCQSVFCHMRMDISFTPCISSADALIEDIFFQSIIIAIIITKNQLVSWICWELKKGTALSPSSPPPSVWFKVVGHI